MAVYVAQNLESKPDDKVLEELLQLTGFGWPEFEPLYCRYVAGRMARVHSLQPGCVHASAAQVDISAVVQTFAVLSGVTRSQHPPVHHPA